MIQNEGGGGRMKSLVATCFAAALLVGCETKAVRDLDPAQRTSYNQGFDDGCQSGLYERNVDFYGAPLGVDEFRRDDARFRTDKEYARAWNEGRESCLAGRPGPSGGSRR